MRNHEVVKSHNLLDENGHLIEPGWSKSLIQKYDRNMIKKRKTRIKEWDYYYIMSNSNKFCLCLTISDLGYLGMYSVSFVDLENAVEHTQSELTAFPLGKTNLPPTSAKGDVAFKNKNLDISFVHSGSSRLIKMNYKTFDNKQEISCDIKLTDEPQDSMVIATPWAEDKKAFYYNQKINCMRASGTVTYKGKIYTLNPETDFAGLDWGRGVWTKDNYWYWGSGSGQINGVPFGFNLGYGFGDTTAASENVIFYDGKANKFDDVVFNISDNYTDPWTIKSSDGRFDMDFTPIIDRNALIDVKVIVTDQHQVFGKMNGTAVLDDGTKIELRDFICFAEKVHNKY
ncbi:DUF2804 domain-containing protein [uncultured Eubacterium sp.]|uniref:DUF2804 domain-containing protein n=1 Tax=uncultured Eubacterium sp. TaxID=165185 RepID=UPI0026336E3B|nr:DUF2804 domain-containing protein [uncultured Eubacterium sp.]